MFAKYLLPYVFAILIHSLLTTPKNFSLNVVPILSGTFPIINSKEKHAKETPFSIA